MKKKLDYKIKEGYDFNNLKQYGFSKTQPKENPWWQYPIQIDWSTGLGFYKESININNKTNEVYLVWEETISQFKHQDVIDKLLGDNALIKL